MIETATSATAQTHGRSSRLALSSGGVYSPGECLPCPSCLGQSSRVLTHRLRRCCECARICEESNAAG